MQSDQNLTQSLILLASSRPNGNTEQLSNLIAEKFSSKIINLSKLNISQYDYNHANITDDFIPLVEQIQNYQKIIFATPIYWYAMSAQMKLVFDRLSDLITIRKEIGRSLAGKQSFLITTGTDSALPEGFEIPFKRTSEYFNVAYLGCLYVRINQDRLPSESEINFSGLQNFLSSM